MSREPTPRAPRGETLAAELALGVLDAAAREAAEARAAADPAFAAEAAAWSARLHPLAEEAAPVEPGPDLWPRIEAALGAPAGTPEPQASEAAAPPPGAQVVELASHRQVRHWRRLAGLAAGLAAACVVGVVVLLARHPVAPAPLLTARLEPPTGEQVLAHATLYTATVDRTRSAVVLTAVGPGPTDPRGRELWVIAKPAAPIAVGMIAPDRTLPLPPQAAAAVRAGAVLAVTLEPPGGAPGPGPSGPVIATGVLAGA